MLTVAGYHVVSHKVCNCYIMCWLSTYGNFYMCDHVLFQIFWVGPGEWGWGYMWLMVPSSTLLILYHCQHKLKGRPQNEGTLSPDTCHTSWSPLHSPSGEGRGQGELSWWCGSPKIELVMKKSTRWRSVSNFLSVPVSSYPLASFSIRKCEMPPWCFMDSERVLPMVSFSLTRKQWYGTLLSLSSAVSCEIQPWYHTCPCSSISVEM